MEAEFIKKIVKEAEKISQKHFEVHQKGDNGDLVTNIDNIVLFILYPPLVFQNILAFSFLLQIYINILV